MPTSYPQNIPSIIEACEALQPKKVLDIGPGYGKYGVIVNEYTRAKVDALEIFEPYIKDFGLKGKYNKVILGNGLDFDVTGYDLVLLIDVIEHWEKDAAKAFLRRAVAAGARVLISTPRAHIPQDAVNGNEWERHVSLWNSPDLDEFHIEERSTALSFLWIVHA